MCTSVIGPPTDVAAYATKKTMSPKLSPLGRCPNSLVSSRATGWNSNTSRSSVRVSSPASRRSSHSMLFARSADSMAGRVAGVLEPSRLTMYPSTTVSSQDLAAPRPALHGAQFQVPLDVRHRLHDHRDDGRQRGHLDQLRDHLLSPLPS